MKYWNKSKKCKKSWFRVEGPSQFFSDNMKLWCQLNGSKKRFFFEGPTVSPSIFPSFPNLIRVNPQIWYFENSEDAVAFKLKWSQGSISTG